MKLNPVSAAPPTITEASAHRRKLRLSNSQFTKFHQRDTRYIEPYKGVHYKRLDKFQDWKSAIQMQIREDLRKKGAVIDYSAKIPQSVPGVLRSTSHEMGFRVFSG